VGNGAKITIGATNLLGIYLTGSADFYSMAGTYTIDGAGAIDFRQLSTGETATLPALTVAGAIANVYIRLAAPNTTIRATGTLVFPGNVFIFTNGAWANTLFDFNGQNFTCTGTLVTGCNSATGVNTTNFGSGTFSIGALGATYNSGTINDNFQTCQLNVAGNVTFGSNHTVNPGTSRITITNTSTITSNGKSIYNFVINAAARTITLANALNIAAGGSVTVTAFTAFAGNQYIIFAGSGAISIATAVSNRLRTAVAGSTITWNTGANIWTIPAYTANDWGGSASGKVMWRSSVPGTQYRISAPAGVVVYYMNPQDNRNSGAVIDALSRTNLDSGNNIGWLFSKGGNAGNSRSRIAISMGI
jgi:hypothetical protein